VRKSESLHAIARKYHVPVDELKSVNNLTGSRVETGVRLIIPSHASITASQSAEKPGAYKVVKGDTLPAIARKTGVRMAELRRLNALKGNRVKPGQVLALTESSQTANERDAAATRLARVPKDLLSENELSETLAELSDIDADRPVDLAKSLESGEIGSLKKSAYSFLGARYRFGGSSRTALDCSSFVQQVFRDQNIHLPRTAREQFAFGDEVVRGDLQKGDMVFFQTYANFPSHVGIYLGNRKMIHASSRDRRVVISSMDTPYYLSRYLGARRVTRKAGSLNFNDLLLGVEEEQENDVLANDTLGLSLKQEM
jgi:cell wall-associated NlpC family hydrolase